MVNIHHRLRALSDASAREPTRHLHFRSRRRLPGGGLYKPLDDVRALLQVHDELLFEVRQKDLSKVRKGFVLASHDQRAAQVARLVKGCMEEAVQLRVPLQVKLSSGLSWGSMQPLELEDEEGDSKTICDEMMSLRQRDQTPSTAVGITRSGDSGSQCSRWRREGSPSRSPLARDLFGRD